MKLATIRSKSSPRHGELVVVSRDNKRAVKATEVAPTLLIALENWREAAPKLSKIFQSLERGTVDGEFALDFSQCLAPLPHAPGFYDGSAFLSHVVRARRARGDEMPQSARVTPLMYQGVSDNLLAWNAPLDLMDVGNGGDFEGEFAVITDDVPKGCPAGELEKHFALFTLFNDITYREIVKTEIETKFGFLQSKPNSSFAPLVVTADEFGSAWDGKRLKLDVEVRMNGEVFGKPNGSEMHFSFGELVAHAGRTRPLAAGTIVGTGTISNEDKSVGYACLTEKRFVEVIEEGKPRTPWLKPGDRVQMDCWIKGVSVFGPVDQTAK